MIKNNFFNFKQLKYVVIFGESPVYSEIKKLNLNKNIKTIYVTSPDQAGNIKSNQVLIAEKFDSKIKKKISNIVNLSQTLFVSLGARWIFKKDDIKKFFNNNIINFHGTRLPYDKGGANVSWKIINGDRIDNQLVHIISEKIDEGHILLHKKSLIPHYCKIPIDYISYQNKEFLKLYEELITRLKKKQFFYLYKQPDYIGNYNPRLSSKISSWIDWSYSSSDLEKFINAFDEPYDGAKTFLNDKEVHLKSIQLHGGDLSSHPFKKGIVARHDKNWIVVNTSDSNSIVVEKVLNKKKENILKYIKEGDRFNTPRKFLDIALSNRIKFTPTGINNKKF